MSRRSLTETPAEKDARRAERDRIDAQCERIAALIGADPEDVVFGRDGVCLTPSQADALLALIPAGAES